MDASRSLTCVVPVLALLAGVPGAAADSEARPAADEQCVAQCDVQSDECMEQAGGDERKQQACDDAYGKCLQQCR